MLYRKTKFEMNKIIVVLLFFSLKCVSQDFINTGSQFEIKLGLTNLAIADRKASPINYKSNLLNVSVGYIKSNSSTFSTGTLQFAMGSLKKIGNFRNESGLFRNALLSPTLSYKYLKSPGRSGNYFGGGFRYQILYAGNGPSNTDYFLGNGAFSFEYTKVFREINLGKPYLNAGVPLLSVITQLPYSRVPRVEGKSPGIASLFRTGTSLNTLNKVQDFTFNMGMERLTGPKTTIGLDYGFQYTRIGIGDLPIQIFQSTISVKGERNF